MSDNKNNKPRAIRTATYLLYFSVVIGIVRTGMTVMRHIDVRTPHFYVGTKLALYALSFFLIYKLAQGYNWAKWAMIALLVAAIPLGVLPTLDSVQHSPLHSALGFVQLAALIVAVVLLFRKPSSDWFASKS